MNILMGCVVVVLVLTRILVNLYWDPYHNSRVPRAVFLVIIFLNMGIMLILLLIRSF